MSSSWILFVIGSTVGILWGVTGTIGALLVLAGVWRASGGGE